MTIKKWLADKKQVSYIDAPIHPDVGGGRTNLVKKSLPEGGLKEDFENILPLMKFYCFELMYIGDRVTVLDTEFAQKKIKVSHDEV